MTTVIELHRATNVDAGASQMMRGRLHTHTAELTTTSGTGSATVKHYGRNGDTGSWHEIVTFTFISEASGSKLVQTLEHAWDNVKSECTAISGTGAAVLTTITGE